MAHDISYQPKLQEAVDKRAQAEQLAQQYAELAETIGMIQSGDGDDIKGLVDLGRGFFVHANAPAASLVTVNIGLGIHVEMTHTEVLAFVEGKTTHLAR